MTIRQLAKDLKVSVDIALEAASACTRKRVTDPDARIRGVDEPRVRAEVRRRQEASVATGSDDAQRRDDAAPTARSGPVNPGARPQPPAARRGAILDDLAAAFGVRDPAPARVVEDVDLSDAFAGVRPLHGTAPAGTASAPKGARSHATVTGRSASTLPPSASAPAAHAPPPSARAFTTELEAHANALAATNAALQRSIEQASVALEAERATVSALRRELDEVRGKWAQLDKALAHTFPLTTENARLADELREARDRLAVLESRPEAMTLDALFALRGVIGEDEAWMAMTALREGGRHGEFMRLLLLAHPELAIEFLEERLILLPEGERPPKGLVALRVPPHRSESPPAITRGIRRLYNGIIALGPRADGTRRELLIVGGRPYQHRQLLDLVDPLVHVRAVPAATRFDARDAPELVVLWGCHDLLPGLRARFPDACVVEDASLAVMLEAAWQHLAGA